jgi:hypothetical protein
MRSLRLHLTLASVAFASLAACSEAAVPTGSVQPGRPSFDSGMVGSGNRDGSTVTTTASDTTTVSRNSGMVGSGN